MRIKHFIVSVTLIMTMFTINTNSEAKTMDSVVLADGTTNEYVVPADMDSSVEAEMLDGYVQANSKKLNFKKLNLEGVSGNLNTVISDVYAKDDGTFLVLLAITNDSSSLVGELYAHVFLLNVGMDGVIIRSQNISTGEVGDGTSAIKRPEEIGGRSSGVLASYPKLYTNNDEVYVAYSGYTPASRVHTAQYFYTDMEMSGNNFEWETASSFTGATQSFAYPQNMYRYSSTKGMFEETDEVVNKSNYGIGLVDVTQYEYAISYPATKTQSSTRTLEVKTFDQMIDGMTFTGTVVPVFRTLSDLITLSNGNIVGEFSASVKDDNGHHGVREIYIWDSNGNKLNSYTAPQGSRFTYQYGISNESELYFFEIGSTVKLKKMSLTTGNVTNVKDFPANSNIQIVLKEDSVYNTKYEFYGYVPRGFEGFSEGAGVILGAMDENFEVVSANSIVTTRRITLNIIDSATGETFVYGSLGTNTTFANEPTVDTNSIDGQGWIDKTDVTTQGGNNNAYFGSMSRVEDYAPGIDVGDNLVVNRDVITTNTEWDDALIKSVDVYDTFDLSDSNPANTNLTDQEIKEELVNRINRNPNDLTADIEWETLGLDNSKVGYNQVKFFVSDSNNQVSADSKGVNVISNQTVVNGDLAIDASNFYIDLSLAKGLDQIKVIESSNAIAWDMNNGTSLNVVVDKNQLSKINSTKVEGVFDLKLTASQNGVTISKTIKVFVGGVVNADESKVLYADGFKLHIDDAKFYSSTQAVNASNAKAYEVDSGNLINTGNFEADVASINSATTIGPVTVPITYSDSDTTLVKDVVASIYDSSVVFGVNDAISAKSIVFSTSEVKSMSKDALRLEVEKRSGVLAWDLRTGKTVSYDFDETVIKQSAGDYNLVFTTNYKTKKSIIVYVFDSPVCNAGGCSDVNATEVIAANSFSVIPEDVSSLTETKVKSLGNARAINLVSNSEVDVITDYSAIKKDFGSYDVVFSTALNTSTTVKATVGNNLVENGNIAIAANDTFFTMDEVIAFESSESFNSEIITRSGARAWVVDTNSELSPVEIGSSDIVYVEVDYSGYEIEYSYVSESEEVFEIIRIPINDDEVVYDAIAAKDFTLTSNEVDELDADKVIEMASAKSWLATDNSPIEIVDVDFSSVETHQGVYDVKLINENNTTITIQVYVGTKNRPTIDVEENIVIFANDYEVSTNEFDKMTEADHIDAAEVLIIDMSTQEELKVEYVDTDEIAKQDGVYVGSFGIYRGDRAVSSYSTVTVISNDSGTIDFALEFIMIGLLIVGVIVFSQLINSRWRR